jgi:uncharacterized repeat protein (TIGR01451 family)
MMSMPGGTLLFAVMTALVGFVPLAAQQLPGATAESPALVMSATNITALEDSIAGRARSEAEATVARPGDVFEYRLLFTNPRPGEVRDIVLQNPVPPGMVFIAGSAAAGWPNVRVEYSTEGGETWSVRPEIEVVLEDGRTERRPAPPEMYTDVRWTLPGGIASGAQVQAVYRVRVMGARAPGGSGSSDRSHESQSHPPTP